MRQTLLYVTIDAPWSILWQGTPQAPILHIGFFWLLLAILLGLHLWVWLFPANLPIISPAEAKQSPKSADKTSPSATLKGQIGIQWGTSLQVIGLGALVYFLSPFRIFPIYGYGSMLLLGFVFGAAWAGRRAEQVQIPRETIWDVAMLILVSGIVGARGFYLLQYGSRVFKEVQTVPEFLFAAINLTEGGLVLYGGVLMGTVAYFTFCWLRKISPLQLADVITPSIFLGLCFGRIGCLLNGCCFGDRCELPWAITFPPGSVPYLSLVQLGFLAPDAPQSLPLQPTQIYSALGALILAFVTATVFKHRRKVGEVLAAGAIFYPINRFLIEFLRGDEFTQYDTGLTISQIVSLGVLAAGVIYLVWLEWYGKPLPRQTRSL